MNDDPNDYPAVESLLAGRSESQLKFSLRGLTAVRGIRFVSLVNDNTGAESTVKLCPGELKLHAVALEAAVYAHNNYEDPDPRATVKVEVALSRGYDRVIITFKPTQDALNEWKKQFDSGVEKEVTCASQ